MNRKQEISFIVEQTLNEQGYFSGLGSGFRDPSGKSLNIPDIPDPPNLPKMIKQADQLSDIANSHPIAAVRSAAQNDLSKLQRDLANIPGLRANREDLIRRAKRMKRGAKHGAMLRQGISALAQPVWTGLVSKAFSAATSSDSGSLRGKGYSTVNIS